MLLHSREKSSSNPAIPAPPQSTGIVKGPINLASLRSKILHLLVLNYGTITIDGRNKQENWGRRGTREVGGGEGL